MACLVSDVSCSQPDMFGVVNRGVSQQSKAVLAEGKQLFGSQ
jgi:hypothetical protein